MELVLRNEQKLLDRLGAEDKEWFEKYIDAQGDVNRLSAIKKFMYGYKLGLIMPDPQDKEKWVIFENTHPAIVDPATWETVQRLRTTARRTDH